MQDFFNMSISDLKMYKNKFVETSNNNLQKMNMQNAKFNPSNFIDENMSYVNSMIFINELGLLNKKVLIKEKVFILNSLQSCKNFYIYTIKNRISLNLIKSI